MSELTKVLIEQYQKEREMSKSKTMEIYDLKQEMQEREVGYQYILDQCQRLVNVLCEGCKWQSCDNLDFCKETKRLKDCLEKYK